MAKCPLCASADVETLFVRDDVPYLECSSCSFRFARPAKNPNLENEIGEYEDAYIQYLQPDPADEATFDVIRRWIERNASLSGAAVLDVGCGGGKFVRYLRARGIAAEGLEPAEALYDKFLAGGEDAASFHPGLPEDFGVDPPRTFGVITALDVIEHVEDPRAFLDDLMRLLEPGGHLFLSTPDVGSLPARLFRSRWHYYYDYHLSYFSRPTLERAAAAAGLEPLSFKHLRRHRSIGYLLRYLFEFALRRPAPASADRLDRVRIPVNLFDVVYATLRRPT